MEYIRNTTKDKWTIMMYMRDFDLMATYAYALRASNNLSTDNIDDILAKMESDGVMGLALPASPRFPASMIMHRATRPFSSTRVDNDS